MRFVYTGLKSITFSPGYPHPAKSEGICEALQDTPRITLRLEHDRGDTGAGGFQGMV